MPTCTCFCVNIFLKSNIIALVFNELLRINGEQMQKKISQIRITCLNYRLELISVGGWGRNYLKVNWVI